MPQLIVRAKKLNKRNMVPAFLPDANSIVGVVYENFIFSGEEVTVVPNPSLGKWYKDKDNSFYWGGALEVIPEPVNEAATALITPDNDTFEQIPVTPVQKRKIESVINAFETGSAEGDYSEIVKYADYSDPETKTRIVQVTYGRSQTTEFGHLKALLQDYVVSNGMYAAQISPYLNHVGKKPSLATDAAFCDALKNAGRHDPIMKTCQDNLFEAKYYQPAYKWFSDNGFTLPLSMLVIYDSIIHSGSILSFLRKKFTTSVPASGGDEKEWIGNYVDARHDWLSNNKEHLLQLTAYRTECLKKEVQKNDWDLSQPIDANGVKIA